MVGESNECNEHSFCIYEDGLTGDSFQWPVNNFKRRRGLARGYFRNSV